MLFSQCVAAASAAAWEKARALCIESATLHPDPATTYQLALCEEALSRSISARKLYRRAIAEGITQPELGWAQRALVHMEGKIARMVLTVSPPDASISIDGRPLELQPQATAPAGALPTAAAGTLDPAPARPAPAGTFELLIDSGYHTVVVSKAGYHTATSSLQVIAPRMPPRTIILDARKDFIESTKRPLLAIGTGLLAGSLALGGIAWQKKAESDGLCPVVETNERDEPIPAYRNCSPDGRRLYGESRDFAAAANALFVSGLGTALLGGLFLLEPWTWGNAASKAGTASMSASFRAGPGQLTLMTSFTW